MEVVTTVMFPSRIPKTQKIFSRDPYPRRNPIGKHPEETHIPRRNPETQKIFS